MAANEKVGIEIELMGGEEAYALLQRIDDKIDTLTKRKKFNTLGGLKSAKGELEGYIKELEEIEQKSQKVRQSMEKWGEPFRKSAAGQRLSKELEESERRAEEVRGEISRMDSEMQSVVTKTRTLRQEFNAASSSVAHVGSAMQSLGNALTRLTSPFRRITTGLLMGAGYKALNMITEGFGGAFERADTMRNYSRSLEAFGFSATDASVAIEELNESVLGLPTGLDEIVALQKKYVAASQDIEKSTGLAIATNNAFLASGSDARQKKTAERIISQLAGGAEIASSSWDALQRAMPLVFTTLAKESKMGVAEYMVALKQGKISTDEFMESFSRVGKEGAIADAANVMKKSWAGLTANIQNATKRMGEGIIKTLNSVFEDATGRDLLSTLLGIDANGKDLGDGIKHWIDGISESAQNWIKAHPQEILDFFNDLKAIDWKGLIRGIAEGASELAKLISAFAKWASGKDMSKLGKWAVRLNALGSLLTIGGGALKGLRHPIAGTWLFGKFLGKKAWGKIGKAGIFGKLAKLFGKSKDVDEAAKTAGKIPKVSDTFKSAFASLEGLIKAAGALTLVAGTGAVVFASAKSILKNLKEMVDLVNGGGWDNVGYVGGGVILAIGTFTEIFQAIGAALGPTGLLNTAIASAASLLVTGTLWADTELIKDGLYNIRDTIKGFDEVANAINSMQGFTSLSDNAKTKISNTIDTIREVANLLVGKNGGPADRGEYSHGIPMFVGARANGVKNIANALKSMQDIVTNVNALASMGINAQGNIKSKLETIGDVIDEVYKAFPRLVRGTAGAANLKKSTTNFADALIGIRRMAYHINKLAGTSVDTGGFASFIAQLKEALASLKDVQGDLELDITVKIATGFQTSVNNVIKSINNAKKKITTAANKGIRLTIPVSIRFSLTSNVGGILGMISGLKNRIKNAGSGGGSSRRSGVQEATGGYIYRARGGNVPFRRRGTDTVPAMLTPGEYVHNKRAVSAFGIDFMRKVNNLDMKGAMNELMHRAGGMANINRGTSIVNNNYNNQKVTINNNGNTGAGFTFKSASRFVGAF